LHLDKYIKIRFLSKGKFIFKIFLYFASKEEAGNTFEIKFGQG